MNALRVENELTLNMKPGANEPSKNNQWWRLIIWCLSSYKWKIISILFFCHVSKTIAICMNVQRLWVSSSPDDFFLVSQMHFLDFFRRKQVDKIISPDSSNFLRNLCRMSLTLAPITELLVKRELTHIPHTWFPSGLWQ